MNDGLEKTKRLLWSELSVLDALLLNVLERRGKLEGALPLYSRGLPMSKSELSSFILDGGVLDMQDPSFRDSMLEFFNALKQLEKESFQDAPLYSFLEKTGALKDDLIRIAVLLMLSFEEGLHYRRIFSVLNENSGMSYPTAGMALTLYGLLYDDVYEKKASFLSGGRSLFFHVIMDHKPGSMLSLTTPLVLSPGAVSFLFGKEELPAGVLHFASFVPSDGKSDENSDLLCSLFDGLLKEPSKKTALFYAADGRRRGIKSALSRASSRGAAVVELSFVKGFSASEIERQSLVLSSFLALNGIPLLLLDYDSKDNAVTKAFRIILNIMDNALPYLVIEGEEKELSNAPADRMVYSFTPSLPSFKKREKLWIEALSGIKTKEDVDFELLSLSYDLSEEEIKNIASRVRAKMEVSGENLLSRETIVDTVLSGSGLDFGGLATRLPASYSWDDTELPQENREVIKTVIDRYRMSRLKEEEWGLKKKNAYGNGISILFAGPSGTGKTMSAMCMAGELGLELYRVDLSQMSSKWIGETEKNIGKVFDEAEKSRCILFFDEADALFAKRTDISTSNDKHANNETAYILQKMEEYDGLSIMATNLYQNFDTAFLRRITYIVRFENPDEKTRLSLWKKVLPKEVPVDPKLDFAVFAERFELSGANIKSIMYAAAYMAAAAGKPVDAECVVRAAKYEMKKLGRMVNASDFGPYGGLF